MGIEIRAPHRIGDEAPNASRDPLGDLARASGFQVRPVTLADDWWRRRGGDPLLGLLKDEEPEPVALVPARPRSAGSDRLMSSMIPDGLIRPVDLGVAGLSLPQPGFFIGHSPTIHSDSPTWSALA